MEKGACAGDSWPEFPEKVHTPPLMPDEARQALSALDAEGMVRRAQLWCRQSGEEQVLHDDVVLQIVARRLPDGGLSFAARNPQDWPWYLGDPCPDCQGVGCWWCREGV